MTPVVSDQEQPQLVHGGPSLWVRQHLHNTPETITSLVQDEYLQSELLLIKCSLSGRNW